MKLSPSSRPIPLTEFHPAPGRRVRHRDGTLFAEAGEMVPASSFYLRLADAGDLLPGMKPAEPAAKPSAANPPAGRASTGTRKSSSKGSTSK